MTKKVRKLLSMKKNRTKEYSATVGDQLSYSEKKRSQKSTEVESKEKRLNTQRERLNLNLKQRAKFPKRNVDCEETKTVNRSSVGVLKQRGHLAQIRTNLRIGRTPKRVRIIEPFTRCDVTATHGRKTDVTLKKS